MISVASLPRLCLVIIIRISYSHSLSHIAVLERWGQRHSFGNLLLQFLWAIVLYSLLDILLITHFAILEPWAQERNFAIFSVTARLSWLRVITFTP